MFFSASCAPARAINYVVEYRVNEGGWIQPNSPDLSQKPLHGVKMQTVVSGGDSFPVVAVPAEGFVFTGWSDGILNAERQEKNVRRNLLIYAWFDLAKS